MNSNDLAKRVRAAVETLIPDVASEQLTDDADIFELGLDSVNAMSLVVALQEDFDLEFDEDEVDVGNFQSVGAITRLVATKLQAG